jgi:hypothetical protein
VGGQHRAVAASWKPSSHRESRRHGAVGGGTGMVELESLSSRAVLASDPRAPVCSPSSSFRSTHSSDEACKKIKKLRLRERRTRD